MPPRKKTNGIYHGTLDDFLAQEAGENQCFRKSSLSFSVNEILGFGDLNLKCSFRIAHRYI